MSAPQTAQTAPGLKDYVTWQLGGDPNGTHLQGEIECDYAALVAVFGEPNGRGDQYKVDAEWVLTFHTFGMTEDVATIYNYKTGKNYLGDEGLPVSEITDWHIGGKEPRVVSYVASMVVAHYRAKAEGR
jgi:hypothetical protein